MKDKTPSTNNDEVRKLAQQVILRLGATTDPNTRVMIVDDALRTLAPQPLQDMEALGKRLCEIEQQVLGYQPPNWEKMFKQKKQIYSSIATQFAASLRQPIKKGK